MKKKGLFITFEGLDGSGKTTQMEILNDYLKNRGFDVVTTIEPGGTKIGRKIRKILLDKENHDISPLAETLLFLASRAELVSEVVAPALREGKIILCDRFFDSTVVYQGIARGLGEKEILKMNLWATGGVVPDITFLLSVKVSKGKKRMSDADKKTDRIELEKDSFKEKIYRGYLDIAKKNKDRIVIIDGENSIKSISEEIKNKVCEYLEKKR
ncbi:MAG: dTMP kinase [Actinobacteria bacterium RBG_19FT_COMBO_36_27]|nr:MAG: dTMP kinase [Actinobacteria bacterium RBG_19FT_COMBO_36_27]